MRCRHLTLVNVRNYRRLDLDLPAGPGVIYGDNGQGKSNLLEALYVLATSKSYRTNQDRDLLNWAITDPDAEPATAFARFAAIVERVASHPRLEVIIAPVPMDERQPALLNALAPTTTKRIVINGTARRGGDLVGHLHVVLFTPEDLDLVTGAPEGRRRYLNITLSQTDRAYYRALVQYNKALQQRNSLLRQLRETRGKSTYLDVWNAELARHGAFITARRADAIVQQGSLLESRYTDLTGDTGSLRLHYLASIAGDEGESRRESDAARARGQPNMELGAVELLHEAHNLERFTRLFERNQTKEVRAGVSLYGPHRDDLSFALDGRELASYGSRGQQRAATVGLKLAEVAFMRQISGEMPLMLLDDVLSELDRPRRDYLARALPSDQQVLLTTADLDVIPPTFLARSHLLRVQAGSVAEGEQ